MREMLSVGLKSSPNPPKKNNGSFILDGSDSDYIKYVVFGSNLLTLGRSLSLEFFIKMEEVLHMGSVCDLKYTFWLRNKQEDLYGITEPGC